jgi:hypothetical protein
VYRLKKKSLESLTREAAASSRRRPPSPAQPARHQ